MKFGKVYPIINLAAGERLPVEYAEAVLSHQSVELVQIRAKSHTNDEYLEAAASLVQIRDKLCSSVRVIVNDDVEVCLKAGADGVHLGQDDLSAPEARLVLGPDKLIGLSTHSIEQVQEANIMHKELNYIALGPIFHTSSKKNPEPSVGIEVLRKASIISKLPIIAIGGITAENHPKGFTAAVISDIANSESPKDRLGQY